MEAENFLANGFATRLAVEAKRGWVSLTKVARTWQPTRLKGIQVSPEFGTPFLAATQVYDVRPVPRKWLSLDRTDDAGQRFVPSGTILVTCSGNVGRATLADRSIEGMLISHDLMRIEARETDWWGWIYAYLRAPTVREMMKAAQYGHIIKHLEVAHLDALPIILLRPELREPFGALAHEVVQLRDDGLRLALEAEQLFEVAVGPSRPRSDGQRGFSISASDMLGRGRRLEAHYHNPIARAAHEAVCKNAKHVEALHSLVERIFVPGRFKHVYGEEGIPYLDSAQILEVAPDIDKRVLSLKGEKQAGYLVDSGSLLIPCSGQTHGIIGSVVIATEWHENKVLTNHIMRLIPKSRPAIRIGYLQTVLGHPTLGRPRILRGAFGSSVPELSPLEVSALPVPRLDKHLEERIADAAEEGAALLAKANLIEEELAERAESYLRRFLAGDRDHIQLN